MIKKALVGVMIVALIFFGIVAMQPSTFLVARSATMHAPPALVFEQINDLHKWQAWSPWAKKDPNATVTFEGPEKGAGAKFHWAGNDEVGEGTMTIVESRPNELVKFKIDFIKPFEDTSTAEFTLKPDGDKTSVMWSMEGESNFIGKIVCLFMDMDKEVGGDFETGLANLKSMVESKPADETKPTDGSPSENSAPPVEKGVEQSTKVSE